MMIRGVSSALAISTWGLHTRGFVHGEQGESKLNRQRQNQTYYSTILQSRQVDPQLVGNMVYTQCSALSKLTASGASAHSHGNQYTPLAPPAHNTSCRTRTC
jgi:hypothetical protein